MKQLALRTQAVVMILLLCVLSGGAWLSYWVAQQSEREIRETLERDLAAMTSTSELRGKIVKIEQATAAFLLSRDPGSLARRDETLQEMRSGIEGLASFLSSIRQAELAKELDKRYGALLADQNDWIKRAEAGQLPPAQAAAREDEAAAGLAAIMVQIRDAATADLQQSRQTLTKASRKTVFVILAAGLAAGLLVVGFLSFYIVRPVAALERKARAWELGKPWAPDAVAASPEVSKLADCIREMAEGLNQRFEKDQELARLKGMLVSIVSHEFANALAVIQDVADKMRDAKPDAPAGEREQLHRMLTANIRSLKAASDTILGMARGASGRFTVQPARIAFHSLLAETLHRLEVVYEKKGIEVELDLPGQPVPVLADAGALTIAINELVSNAIQFTPERGKVALGLRESPAGADRVRFFIQDSGPGMTPEEIQRLLASTAAAGELETGRPGVGLGMVRGIVEAHSSILEVESAPGKGSLFSFDLPLLPAETEPENAPAAKSWAS